MMGDSPAPSDTGSPPAKGTAHSPTGSGVGMPIGFTGSASSQLLPKSPPRTYTIQRPSGDIVTLEFSPSGKPIEAPVPPDLRRALAAAPAALAVWKDITPVARRDWILWITTAKQAETRTRRVASACDMLGSGKRRVCCFDRSGFYSKEMSAPAAKAP